MSKTQLTIYFITHPLAGELTKHRSNVTGVLSHDLSDCLLYSDGYATSHTGHDLLEFKKRQRRIPEGHHQRVDPLLQLYRCRNGYVYIRHPVVPDFNLLPYCFKIHVWFSVLTLSLKYGSGRQYPSIIFTRFSRTLWNTW